MRFAGLVVGPVLCLGLLVGGGPVWERVHIDDGDGDRVVEAEVVVEAADGGLLIEHADQRLEVVQPADVRGRERLPCCPEPPSPKELAADVLRTLPAGFESLTTRHYVVCFDTSRAYAQWCATLFERLHNTFLQFWQHAGLELESPPHPLVVVIFADRQRYEEHVVGDLGNASDRVVGFYNLLSNRVTTFDLTGSDLVTGKRGRTASRAGLEILASRQASGLVATLVHEATHQMAFNCGMHRRLAPVPLWVSEGIAIYFETPDLSSDRGWRGIGGVNHARRDRFLAAPRRGWLEGMIRGDEVFRDADEAVDAYAGAWAVTAFLVQTRRAAYIDYLRMLSSREPLGDDTPEGRLADFEAAFGKAPTEFEELILKFVARLK